MKRLCMLLAFIAITITSTTVFAQGSPDQMVKEWQRAKAYTKQYLDAMPEDGYTFKPTPEMRAFAAQMLHIADANTGLAAMASGKTDPNGKNSAEKTVAQTKDATTKCVMDSYDFVIDAMQGMTPAQMLETAPIGGGQSAAKGLLFVKAFEHQTHHRGQTTVYLRLKGVKPPAEMLF